MNIPVYIYYIYDSTLWIERGSCARDLYYIKKKWLSQNNLVPHGRWTRIFLPLLLVKHKNKKSPK